MKYIIFLFFLQLGFYSYSQEYYKGTLNYKISLSFNKASDSIKYYGDWEKYSPELLKIFSSPVSEKYLVKKDTVLIYQFLKEDVQAQYILISTKNKLDRLDVTSGQINKWGDFSPKKYLKFNSYKRIADEDEIILQKECSVWLSTSKNGWRKVWLTNIDEKLPSTEGSQIFLDGKLILKQVSFFNDGRIITKQIANRGSLSESNFGKLIGAHNKIDIKSKYLPIADNSEYHDKALKKGDLAPNLHYRNIFENKLSCLYESTQKSKYTIIELWGTWCVPCLLATEKIKMLRKKFKAEHLSIISLNCRDRNIEKVKSVIEKKDMKWEHGYTTEKLTSIFNKKRSYPKLLILDNNNKVLFIGNPQTDIDEIEAIIAGK
ncbi:thioredoxin-like protein [Ancylomarina subtilis]|uniref:Thioredoxin-like protein n=1 Tax=Ancylomarina subtilis TaxID=1639035 RepID=A0A4Q7VHZ0_9BACT|nr:thioredoxin-like domain-containing protein [Ancylomarina subtilis]RZT95736.1 thioredoxin-like protein [Ancylomarina subtilis]